MDKAENGHKSALTILKGYVLRRKFYALVLASIAAFLAGRPELVPTFIMADAALIAAEDSARKLGIREKPWTEE